MPAFAAGTIVKVERINELHPLIDGDFIVCMDDRTQLTLSRRFVVKLKSLLGWF